DHSMKVVGNLVGTKRRLALAFGLRNEDKLLETYRKRRGAGAKPRRVKDGPVKEVVLRSGKQVDLNALPIPIYHEEDAGPYITCGILTAKDPETGLRSMGLHRLQVKDSRHLGIHLANPPISRFVAKAEESNRPLSAPSGRTHVVVSLKKRHDSDPKQLLHFLLAGVPYIKNAVVVDDDVNVQD